MLDHPTATDLLDAVARFLHVEIGPRASGRSAFLSRVAANMLDMVRRQILLEREIASAELGRLTSLLGCDGERRALNWELCERIGSGLIEIDDPKLIEHLWATTMAAVAVDQPNYATYRRAASPECATRLGPGGDPA